MAENMCIFCQEYREVIGHVTTSCPHVKCKNCDQKGHFKMNCEIDELEDGLEVELNDVKSTLNSDNFIKVKDIKSLTKIVEEGKGENGKVDALSFYFTYYIRGLYIYVRWRITTPSLHREKS